jgi:hypothetical protein
MSLAPTISRQAKYSHGSAVPSTAVDYDLHGLAGVRLIDATPRDRAVVDAQLGPIAAPLAREPDITIRFVDRIPLSGPMRLLGVDDVGYTDDTFLVLRARHKTRARVAIPFDKVGCACEIVCERGLPAVPLLISILNLTVLAKGGLPMHASACSFMAIYRKFRFAFPDRANPLVELAAEIERKRLQQMLEGKEAYAVYHPYPPAISELFATVRPLVEG